MDRTNTLSMRILANMIIWMIGLIIPTSVFAQQTLHAGIWDGYIHIRTDSLKLVLVLSEENGRTVAVLDSPDQYATDIPTDTFSQKQDTIFFSSKQTGISFKGLLLENGNIQGIFRQNGLKLNLTLSPTTERKLFPRPQEPHAPYPYTEQELTIPQKNSRFGIRGTLTLPAEDRKALIILISGSGWQDRDETIFEHRPFKLIADQLTRAGYIVFRYDDAPQGEYAKMSTVDFSRQVETIINYFRERDESIPIGLIGHSEGALVAWMTAAQNPDISFIISLAGPACHLDQILLYQNDVIYRSYGNGEEQIAKIHRLNEKIYNAVIKAKNPTQASEKTFLIIKKETAGMSDEEIVAAGLTQDKVSTICMQIGSNWFYTLMHLHAEDYLKKIQCPMLALNGSRDTQVEAAANLALITQYTKKNPDVTTMELEQLNHLFQECETGLLEEYGLIEQTMSPNVIQIIIQWLENH